METNTEPDVPRTRRIWLALVTGVVLLSLLVIWQSARMSRTMSAAASNERQFTQNGPGTKTKIVVEIGESTPKRVIRGKLLQKKTEEIYLRTGTPVAVQLDEQTKLVMGKEADIHPGAVVHITGTIRDDHSILAEQLVILTGYVQIQ